MLGHFGAVDLKLLCGKNSSSALVKNTDSWDPTPREFLKSAF